jgi:uncharacterized protein YqjF (DUF2071 family)
VVRDAAGVEPEPITSTSPRPFRRSSLVQRWEDLTFLHWSVDPAEVAPLLPHGTVPDVLDGVTYVGLIGFRMVGLGLLSGPAIPYLGTFCETNVRLYSVDARGRRAVVFRSLEAERLLPVLVANAVLQIPYKWARMRFHRDGDVLRYSSRRRTPGGPRSDMVVRVGERIAEPSALEHFLTARWGLHERTYGRTLHLPNVHEAWPLHRAELLSRDDQLIGAAGLPQPERPPDSVLYSPGVAVRFGAPSLVR